MNMPSPVISAGNNLEEELNAPNAIVRFFPHPENNDDMIEIKFPGNKLNVFVEGVQEKHKMMFPNEYRAYSENQDQLVGKTPLHSVSWIDPAIKDHYISLNIVSVEALAGLTDSQLSAYGPGISTHREKAREMVVEKEKARLYDEESARAAQALEDKKALEDRIAKLEKFITDQDQKNKTSTPQPKAKAEAA